MSLVRDVGWGGGCQWLSHRNRRARAIIEVLCLPLRSKSSIPPDYDIQIGPRTKSEVPGFDAISVTFATAGKSSKPLTFLLSTDGKTLAQFNKYDISKDPKLLVSGEGRPARGGPANAPVLIVWTISMHMPVRWAAMTRAWRRRTRRSIP